MNKRLVKDALEKVPSIIFIDELDRIGTKDLVIKKNKYKKIN
jgi:ATP-dependent 26S proteasome regulatory subunit